jgi:hypothetical protein
MSDDVTKARQANSRDAAMLMERARCLGLARMVLDASEAHAENSGERNALAAAGDVLKALILQPEMQVKRPMTAEPQLPRKGHFDPVRLDMLVSLIVEFLRIRKDQPLTEELILERARNGAIYIEESLCSYERDDTDPAVQVLLARAADSKH